MKNAPLQNFTYFLQHRPESENDAECYETNKQLAKDVGAKAMYEERWDFWTLVDKAPAELHGKKDDVGISLDVLWAEEQIDQAFQNA